MKKTTPQMTVSKLRPMIFRCLPLLFSLLVLGNFGSGCGGGTSGTGGGTFSVSGTLRTQANQPIAGVRVSVVRQGVARVNFERSDSSTGSLSTLSDSRIIESDVTDTQGQFMLELENRPNDLTLRFSGESFESDARVDQIPETATGVKLNYSFDEESGELSEDDEQFEEGRFELDRFR